jgi:hypothetical protein
MTRNRNGKQGKGKNVKAKGQQRKLGGLAGAPAAVSENLRQYTRFKSSSTGEGMVMEVCLPICEVGTGPLAPPSSVPGGILTPGAGHGQSGQLALTTFEIQNAGTSVVSGYTSPVFDLIASAFVRYRVRKCKFHYSPQSPTTNANRMVFAFAEDPVHPLIWNAGVSSETLLACADSIPFAPWVPWELDVTRRLKDQNLLYTYDGVTENTGTEIGMMQRFSAFGCIGLVASGAAETNTSYGVLYMCLSVELVEFCPVSTTRPSLIDHARESIMTKGRLGTVARAGKKEERKKHSVTDPEKGSCEGTFTDARYPCSARELLEEPVRPPMPEELEIIVDYDGTPDRKTVDSDELCNALEHLGVVVEPDILRLASCRAGMAKVRERPFDRRG